MSTLTDYRFILLIPGVGQPCFFAKFAKQSVEKFHAKVSLIYCHAIDLINSL